MTALARIVILGCAVVVASATSAISGSFGSLSLERLDGAPASLETLRGRVVLLNFWATWCKPCVKEMPLLADLATRHDEGGLVVVAASVDEPDARSEVESMAGDLPAAMQVWVGATLDDMERLGVGGALPVTVLLDRGGALAHLHHGPLEPGSLDDDIDALMNRVSAPDMPRPQDAEKSPAAPFVRDETVSHDESVPQDESRSHDHHETEEAEVVEADAGAVASRVPS